MSLIKVCQAEVAGPILDLYDAIPSPSGYTKPGVAWTFQSQGSDLPEITRSPFTYARPHIPPIQASNTGFNPITDEAIGAVRTEKALCEEMAEVFNEDE
ncbi:hypothetical protein FRC02_007475 [Tulasnella sp. 418]|nr:hypothetical protein FRC02_007475 [Tulasnella sp. 418]